MHTEMIEKIDRDIKRARETAEFGSSIERLRSNKDFQVVFAKGYFEQEAIRLVHLKADPSMQGVDSQKSIMTQMDAVGALSQYLSVAMHMGRLASKEIEDGESVREELLSEELNNG